MRSSKHVWIGLLAVVFVCGVVTMLPPLAEQAEATGYFDKLKKGKCDVPPTWGGVIRGKKRWVLTFKDKKGEAHAYIDCQTGLVWDAAPEFFFFEDEPPPPTWGGATLYCINRTSPWLGQKGGRLPSVAELASLVDTTSDLCMGDGPCLPDGHPFGDQVQSAFYWSASSIAVNPSFAWIVTFTNGDVVFDGKGSRGQAWCVRGAMSADAY